MFHQHWCPKKLCESSSCVFLPIRPPLAPSMRNKQEFPAPGNRAKVDDDDGEQCWGERKGGERQESDKEVAGFPGSSVAGGRNRPSKWQRLSSLPTEYSVRHRSLQLRGTTKSTGTGSEQQRYKGERPYALPKYSSNTKSKSKHGQ